MTSALIKLYFVSGDGYGAPISIPGHSPKTLKVKFALHNFNSALN